jgi:hypothetical protein
VREQLADSNSKSTALAGKPEIRIAEWHWAPAHRLIVIAFRLEGVLTRQLSALASYLLHPCSNGRKIISSTRPRHGFLPPFSWRYSADGDDYSVTRERMRQRRRHRPRHNSERCGESYIDARKSSLDLGTGMRAAPDRRRFAKIVVAHAPSYARLSRYILWIDFDQRRAGRAFDRSDIGHYGLAHTACCFRRVGCRLRVDASMSALPLQILTRHCDEQRRKDLPLTLRSARRPRVSRRRAAARARPGSRARRRAWPLALCKKPRRVGVEHTVLGDAAVDRRRDPPAIGAG